MTDRAWKGNNILDAAALVLERFVHEPEVSVYQTMSNTRPFLISAIVCERIIPEPGGITTAVRIGDTFTLNTPKNLPPGTLPGLEIGLLVILKSGDFAGKGDVTVNFRHPGGKILLTTTTPVVFNGGEHGAALQFNMQIGVQDYGLFWFDVLWNDQALTSSPLKLVMAEESATSA